VLSDSPLLDTVHGCNSEIGHISKENPQCNDSEQETPETCGTNLQVSCCRNKITPNSYTWKIVLLDKQQHTSICGTYILSYKLQLSETLGFWTLSTVRNSESLNPQRFENWIGFRVLVRGGRHTLWIWWFRLDPSKVPNRVGVSLLRLRTETDPVSETLCFLAIQNFWRWAKSKNPVT
jgi:hypothetical protein